VLWSNTALNVNGHSVAGFDVALPSERLEAYENKKVIATGVVAPAEAPDRPILVPDSIRFGN
jgi:hypothetical protein